MLEQAEVSPDVLRDLHALELQDAKRRALWHAVVLAIAVALWTSTGGGFGAVAVMIALLIFRTGRSALDWQRLRRVDPATLSSATQAAEGLERAAQQQRHVLLLTSRPPYVTTTLIALSVGVALAQVFGSRTIGQSVNVAGLVKSAVRAGEWWRLLSGTFMHIALPHLLGNMLVLFAVGRLVEAYVPRFQLALVYLLSGLAGSLASLWLLPLTPSIGASGAIMGVAGFVAVMGRRRADVPADIGSAALSTCALTALVGLIGFRFIDNAGHAGGFVAGALLAWLLVKDGEEADTARSRGVSTIGLLALVVLVVGAAATSWRLVQAGPAPVISAAPPGSFDDVAPIRSATVDMPPGSSIAVITNGGTHAIEAFIMDVYAGVGSVQQRWFDDCCFSVSVHAHEHPIPPGGTRRVQMGSVNPRQRAGSRIVLALVEFDDGTFEGSPRAHEWLKRQRRAIAAEATSWIDAIEGALGSSRQTTRLALADQINRNLRGGLTAQLGELVGLSELAMAATRVPEAFPRVARQTKSRLEEIRAELITRVDR